MTDSVDRLDELRLDRGPEERPRVLWRGVVAVLVLAAVVVVAWVLLRDRPIAVSTATVVEVERQGAEVAVLDASGYVVARRQATVSSKTTGRIVEVLVEEGMAVEDGQLLARLDDALPSRQVALSEAELTAAETEAKEAAVGLDRARRDVERAGRLREEGVGSVVALEEAETGVDALAARVETSRARVDVARRQLALRRQELEDTRIRAPFAGVAVSKDAQPGEMISPVSAGGGFTRTGVATIVDMASLEIEVDVNEAYIQRVEGEQRVVAVLDAYPDWRIPAHVITVVPAADRQKATFKVRIGIEELGDPRLLPDMGVKVSFQAEAASVAGAGGRSLLVPESAVATRDGGSFVFVLRDGSVERRAVTRGGRSGNRVEVVAGLRPGDEVVVTPPDSLADGAAVRVE